MYGLICMRPGEVKRFECFGTLAALAMASYYREEGYAVTVLPPCKASP
jgi:hypothetical protein